MKFRDLTFGEIIQFDDGRIDAFFFVDPKQLKPPRSDAPAAEVCVHIPSKDAPVEEYTVEESPIAWFDEHDCYLSYGWQPSVMTLKTLERVKEYVLRRLI